MIKPLPLVIQLRADEQFLETAIIGEEDGGDVHDADLLVINGRDPIKQTTTFSMVTRRALGTDAETPRLCDLKPYPAPATRDRLPGVRALLRTRSRRLVSPVQYFPAV
ncbi:MAG: hypothetical protein M9953_03765 [Thermomicrobiales bacterium]|nr:hypothetical protein [Thermomicrobiales bacterium]